MALHLTDRNVAHDIAERIRMLIARQDHGDVTAAARRLERPIADVYLPERVISSGDEPAVIDFLATIIRTYEADVCWLITGATTRSSGKRTLSIEDRTPRATLGMFSFGRSRRSAFTSANQHGAPSH